MANIILPQVDILSEINDNTNVLVEQDGNINRINASTFSQITIDKTLTIEDAAADAKTVGNAIGKIEFDQNITDLFDYENAYINLYGNTISYESGGCTNFIECSLGDKFLWSGSIDLNNTYAVVEYDENKQFIKGNVLASNGYTMTYSIPYVITEGKYVKFCTLDRNKSSLLKVKNIDGITYLKDISNDYIYSTNGIYLNAIGDEISVEGATITLTDYISCIEGTKFIVSLQSKYDVSGCCFYNMNKQHLLTLMRDTTNGYIASSELIIAPTNAYYVRFCSYESDKYPLIVLKYEDLNLRHSDYQLYKMIEETKKSNVLYGKKYVACGDSFTEGDFSNYTDENGKTGKDSNAYDVEKKMWKTYPWHIADRNNMILINEAKSGSDFVNLDGASNPFSVSRYLAVPTDADYITLEFGLNETSIGANTDQIGTSSDTTNTTLWGAYNIIFEHFYTNMPFAKIGVIISDAWMPENYTNAVKEICKYWGVPVLNLKGDENIPMTIGGKHYTTSSIATSLKNTAFQVTDTDSHPNYKAHQYRSTIIENFLRSL